MNYQLSRTDQSKLCACRICVLVFKSVSFISIVQIIVISQWWPTLQRIWSFLFERGDSREPSNFSAMLLFFSHISFCWPLLFPGRWTSVSSPLLRADQTTIVSANIIHRLKGSKALWVCLPESVSSTLGSYFLVLQQNARRRFWLKVTLWMFICCH